MHFKMLKNVSKCVCSRDPAGELTRLLADFKGAALRRDGWDKDGKRREWIEEEGGEEREKSFVQPLLGNFRRLWLDWQAVL